MSSHFGQAVHEARHRLTQQLLSLLLNVQPEDDNYSLALDFCLQKEYYHGFADVNLAVVETFYAELVQRLLADGQYSKAAALSGLTAKLLAADLKSQTADLNHNVLQLLANLSERPLETVLQETPELVQLLYNPAGQQLDSGQQLQQNQDLAKAAAQQQQEALQRFRGLLQAANQGAASESDTEGAAQAAANSIIESDYDPYSEQSDLSSWESDGKGDSQQQPQMPTAKSEVHLELEAAVPAEGPAAAAATDVGSARVHIPVAGLQPPHQLVPIIASLGATHLLSRLSAARLSQLPFLRPKRAFCFTEPYLAQQLLRVLQGQQAHGFSLAIHQNTGPLMPTESMQQLHGFVPDRRVTSPGLSSGALHALMQEFAAAGTATRQLRQLAQQLTKQQSCRITAGTADSKGAGSGSSLLDGTRSCSITPCMRALGVALQQQLDLMGNQIVQLLHEHKRCSVQCSTMDKDTAAFTLKLLSVKQLARPMMCRLTLLHATVFSVLQQLGGSPAEQSAALLDGLYRHTTTAAMAASGAQGAANAATLLHLLLCACVPIITAVAQWLWGSDDGAAIHAAAETSRLEQQAGINGSQQEQQAGCNACCSEDFFVIKKAAVPAADPRFWHAAFGFSTSRCICDNGVQDANETAAESRVACPAFLLPLANRILTAGKAVRLLDYMDQDDLKRSSFGSSGRHKVGGNVPAADWLSAKPSACSSSSSRPAAAQVSAAGPVQCNFSSTAMRGRWSWTSSRNSAADPGKQATTSRSSGTSFSILEQPAAADVARQQQGHTGVPDRKLWHTSISRRGEAGISSISRWSRPDNDAHSILTRQVQRQLMVATTISSSRVQEDQLAQGFVAAASRLLQGNSHSAINPYQQHMQAGSDSDIGNAAIETSSSARQLLYKLLEAAGQQLSQPCSAPGSRPTSQQQQQHQQHKARGSSLREILLHAKTHRGSTPSQAPVQRLAGQQQCQNVNGLQQWKKQQQQQEPASVQEQQINWQADAKVEMWHSSSAEGQAFNANSEAPAAQYVSQHPGPCTPAVAAAVPSGDAFVPGLLQWRQQMEARLSEAGSCLQQMAPWHRHLGCKQPNCQQACVPAATGKSTDGSTSPINLLSRSAAAQAVPCSFSSSLASLWPLKAARGQSMEVDAGATDADHGIEGGHHWLSSCQSPGHQLQWLLLAPPRQLLPLPQLFQQALLQPIKARVDAIDRQLLSSLMGEWELLQQLQGLVGVFLLASPSVVEWADSCFAAVEAAAAARKGKMTTRATAGAACARDAVDVELLLGLEEVDVTELELLLQDLASSASSKDPLPDPSCLHLTLNTTALTKLRNRRQQQQQQQQSEQQQEPGVTASAAAGTARPSGMDGSNAGVSATGGVWCCSAEWVGLELRHSGSWQLSLVYDQEDLDRFSMAWRFLLQLRWVGRRLDAARHRACKGTQAAAGFDVRDAQEAAAVEAALRRAPAVPAAAAAAASGRSLYRPGAGTSATSKFTGPAGGPSWLSGRQELLLLQEMGHLMGRWQQYIMDRLLRGAWSTLEQALNSAVSLDEVRAAAATFLGITANLCGARRSGKGSGATWRPINRELAGLMDAALEVAAAAGRLRELRQHLAKPNLDAAAAQRCWLDLSAARARLATAAGSWRVGCGYLLHILSVRSMQLGDEDILEALMGALDMNGYYQAVMGLAGYRRQVT